jgi:hypothetical protein
MAADHLDPAQRAVFEENGAIDVSSIVGQDSLLQIVACSPADGVKLDVGMLEG